MRRIPIFPWGSGRGGSGGARAQGARGGRRERGAGWSGGLTDAVRGGRGGHGGARWSRRGGLGAVLNRRARKLDQFDRLRGTPTEKWRGRSDHDQTFQCGDTLSPTSNGSVWRPSYLCRRGGARTSATVSSSTQCCTERRLAFPGVICRNVSAPGTTSTIDSPIGRGVAYGSGSTRRCASASTRPDRSSTVATSGRIKMPPAEKGGRAKLFGS